MNARYEDIISRIKEEPTWYDNNGTPRYGEFHPDKCPSIYSSHVGLFRILCQDCNKSFMVEMHSSIWGFRAEHPPQKWHYGDPPIHGCVGDTMNCFAIEVREFWTKESLREWERKEEFEGEIG